MNRYLLFRLHGPMASWGEVAVGERRPTAEQPTRSALLGMMAAALGIPRVDSARLDALYAGYGVGSRVDAPGTLLVDYHTAQVADEKQLAKRPPAAARADELAFPSNLLDTMLSTRDYRCDALAVGCVWARPGARWSLEELAEALRAPAFVLYLGRKSCPLDLPLSPRIVEARSAREALLTRDDREDAFLKAACKELGAPVLDWGFDAVLQRSGGEGVRLHWDNDATEPVDAKAQRRRRRDEPRSRTRWQFTERDEWMVFDSGSTPAEQETEDERPLSVAYSASRRSRANGCVLGHVTALRCAPQAHMELFCKGRAGARLSLSLRGQWPQRALLHAIATQARR